MKNRTLLGEINKMGTCAEFAKLVSEDTSTISRVINGHQILPFWKKLVWAKALGSSVDVLFKHEEEIDRADRQLWSQCETDWSNSPDLQKEFHNRIETYFYFKKADGTGLCRQTKGRSK